MKEDCSGTVDVRNPSHCCFAYCSLINPLLTSRSGEVIGNVNARVRPYDVGENWVYPYTWERYLWLCFLRFKNRSRISMWLFHKRGWTGNCFNFAFRNDSRQHASTAAHVCLLKLMQTLVVRSITILHANHNQLINTPLLLPSSTSQPQPPQCPHPFLWRRLEYPLCTGSR